MKGLRSNQMLRRTGSDHAGRTVAAKLVLSGVSTRPTRWAAEFVPLGAAVNIAKSMIVFLVLCGAVSTGLVADPLPQSKKAQPTAEQAKDALLRFIRANRTAFIGDPDPDKFARIPVKPLGEGRCALGAFRFDLSNLSYTAAIGVEGPASYFYSGAFARRDGAWTATAPNVQHALRRLPDRAK